MLIAAFAILAAAAALGTALALVYLRGGRVAAPLLLTALHGLFGLGGLVCLVLALQGPPRGLDQGTASFGVIAAALLAAAALAGLTAFFRQRGKPQRAGTLIGLHATLAVSGVVILAAYLLA
ncbi:MAG TPA: hypothetical protein VMF12_07885 [Xanthobacteraceae bacterium]|nr:hypothetical protein [Xanthobacteraceae bacterium]